MGGFPEKKEVPKKGLTVRPLGVIHLVCLLVTPCWQGISLIRAHDMLVYRLPGILVCGGRYPGIHPVDLGARRGCREDYPVGVIPDLFPGAGHLLLGNDPDVRPGFNGYPIGIGHAPA